MKIMKQKNLVYGHNPEWLITISSYRPKEGGSQN
jgi:hypothetical protein